MQVSLSEFDAEVKKILQREGQAPLAAEKEIIGLYRKYLSREDSKNFAGELTVSIAPLVSPNLLLGVIIPLNGCIPDDVVEYLFFSYLDTFEREELEEAVKLVSVWRYGLLEILVNKLLILDEVAELMQKMLRVPAEA